MGTLGRTDFLAVYDGEASSKEEKWNTLTENLKKSKEESKRREFERIEGLVKQREEIRLLQKAWYESFFNFNLCLLIALHGFRQVEAHRRGQP